MVPLVLEFVQAKLLVQFLYFNIVKQFSIVLSKFPNNVHQRLIALLRRDTVSSANQFVHGEGGVRNKV